MIKDIIEVQSQSIADKHDAISHGFFGRRGGVSAGLYKSLNCGSGSHDNPEHVVQNRERVTRALGVSRDQLASVWQVHSSDCLYMTQVSTSGDKRPKADAMVTDKVGLALGILTADCGPVLFAGLKKDGAPIIGAAHAGWGGAIKGVCEATVEVMIEHGAVLSSISVAIGPCIGPKSYEVSLGYEKPFMEQDEANEHFFKPASREGHLMFDLPGYIASRLARVGVKQIEITGVDTFSNEERFFSYRRTTHRGEADYGRQISAICIQK
ncbi:MAG: peptidoglycan editing factor PgeF [Alphaproteobacteria bacterium]|nr:peptidoglycan editing factor PgeF [Alphaproteobacteria bacterium]NCQ88212.1 peptidoglycan editing factor PgeF [Alphaproteobacteria bacterium]NCT05281.1 peptidoglycan editing factor PgeF [Alphaproteobacteria bacterium]